jgi:heme/copper-type cytochrome/quinol oxidase subunit 3
MNITDKNKTGIMYFVGSEAFFFLSLMIAFIYYALPQAELSVKYLDMPRTLVFTAFLIISSFTFSFSLKMMKKEKKVLQMILLGVTFLFGLIFIIGQGEEYSRLFSVNMNISTGVFGTTFFTLTGFHGLHVIIGLAMIIMIAVISFSGMSRIEGIFYESVSIYWHFVDVVWIFVFSLAYIIPILMT